MLLALTGNGHKYQRFERKIKSGCVSAVPLITDAGAVKRLIHIWHRKESALDNCKTGTGLLGTWCQTTEDPDVIRVDIRQ
jgi:hypothetical protein